MVHYIDGVWHTGNPGVIGPATHGFWMASVVFDGARWFEGVSPDLDLHCQRVIASAKAMALEPKITAEDIETLVIEGLRQLDPQDAVYIRPSFYAEAGFIVPEAASTRFILTLYESPMPDFETGFSACLSDRTKPTPMAAPTHAKASCLYPNAALAIKAATERGFDNAVMCDPMGNVAEFASANLFMVLDGVVRTAAINGTFLKGITRQRVIGLLREDGFDVVEGRITPMELERADEIFCTGNYPKVLPLTRYETRSLPVGPCARRAR
ncbi:MAG: branched-chain amino acid aminotransferase, partial [Pseudomonadota bacterium]